MKIKKILLAGAAATAIFVGGNAASASGFDPHSVVDHLRSNGADYSFSNRAELAKAHNITGYRGSASQNVELLYVLQGDTLPVAKAKAKVVKQEVATQKAEPKAKAAAAPKKEAKKADPQGTTMTVSATAYTAYCTGCSGVTATGIDLRSNPNQKVIAVDPRIIPLGSRVYVEGYGEAIAGDTGGAIKGHKIDLFMASQSDAINFGRKAVKITILN